MSYNDPLLGAIDEADNPYGADQHFFRRVAHEHPVTDIMDLGCGTGILTVTMTGSGRTVTGVDPTPPCWTSQRTALGVTK